MHLDKHRTLPIPSVEMAPWESQAGQYPATGTPGFDSFQVLHPDFPGGPIDCLLLRDATGALAGILNHFGYDMPPSERAGNVNLWVHPGWRRRGIGTAMLLHAMDRWADIDLFRQSYTAAGRALAQRCLAVRDRSDHPGRVA